MGAVAIPPLRKTARLRPRGRGRVWHLQNRRTEPARYSRDRRHFLRHVSALLYC